MKNLKKRYRLFSVSEKCLYKNSEKNFHQGARGC